MTEVLVGIGALAVAILLCHFVVVYVSGIPLLCHLGLHRWQKVLAGQGRDARYVVRCKGCQKDRDDE